VSVSTSLALGVPLGLLASFVGGFVDGIISHLTDAFLACPFLILAIASAGITVASLSVLGLGQHLPAGAVLQPAGRRAARRAGPEVGSVLQGTDGPPHLP